MHATIHLLRKTDFPPIRRRRLQSLQVNLGYRCNQSCQHCHVAAGPNRTEMMDADNAALVASLLRSGRIATLDLTGGAPELSPHFRDLVRVARASGVRVIDRCNLTILFEPGQDDLAPFLAAQGVDVVASLPCYTEDNVDAQRGDGVFEKSINALQWLNRLGYGQPDSDLSLDLVYNPLGPTLPPPQDKLQADYKRLLGERFGIVFDRLLTIANMPIQRFGSMLVSKGQFDGYMQTLHAAHRSENLDGVMCRDLISVDWQGYLHDCDFNQMLGLPLGATDARHPRPHLRELLTEPDGFCGRPITIADHCYGCTAGQGSSCGGALESTHAGAQAVA
ncbi:MAG: arsenosugar biosynthesis radical SAM protein ArsS [Betaproteobacteria bacterium]|nr:arsenosugar biosynthesis radical SAM protein ArsS [Betaproteobacteria bacterium]MDE2124414.1 arsenosugar biosynthesis radical SAM protein ArsS [Betaproteobacteria bacterium]MDE2186802.1 arsenosugar biosynthesis radical SAM protein ArsS [Betaproteobacteria bacterium]MDE2325407.1 arsenosugar biosynthesis radical SAM protein ArsS [Betaproteobacteria bacterium]